VTSVLLGSWALSAYRDSARRKIAGPLDLHCSSAPHVRLGQYPIEQLLDVHQTGLPGWDLLMLTNACKQ
jgi:hypothetical protein